MDKVSDSKRQEARQALNQVLDYLSTEHAWQDQEKAWEASGDLPDDFERVYCNEREYHQDEVRLNAMGYRPIRRHEIGMLFGWILPYPDAFRVTYGRNPNPKLAPGTSYADEPEDLG